MIVRAIGTNYTHRTQNDHGGTIYRLQLKLVDLSKDFVEPRLEHRLPSHDTVIFFAPIALIIAGEAGVLAHDGAKRGRTATRARLCQRPRDDDQMLARLLMTFR